VGDFFLTIEIITPDHVVMHQSARSVVLPGTQGEMEILPGHLPLLSTLEAGTVVVKDGSGAHFVAVSTGFVEVFDDHVSVLVETAESEAEIDLARARAMLRDAKDHLAVLPSEDVEERFAFETALGQAQASIAVYRRLHADVVVDPEDD